MNLKTYPLIEKGSHTNLLQQTPTTELQKTIKYAFIKYRIVAMKCTPKLEINQLKPSCFVFSCLTSQSLPLIFSNI